MSGEKIAMLAAVFFFSLLLIMVHLEKNHRIDCSIEAMKVGRSAEDITKICK
jgi:hypothetical protein